MPTLPTAAPRWVVDPDFNLDFHVRRVRVPEPGTLREVFDMAEVILQSPLDISRPLWSVTLIEGLAGGRAAQLLHLSHAVADGVGIVAMFGEIYDLERDPAPRPAPPLPIPQDLSPNDLMREGINGCPAPSSAASAGRWSGAIGAVGQDVSNPASACRRRRRLRDVRARRVMRQRRRALAVAAPAQPVDAAPKPST